MSREDEEGTSWPDNSRSKPPGVSFISAPQRASAPGERERIRSASRVIDQSEHVDWHQKGAQVRLHLSPGGLQEVTATFGADSRGIRRLSIQRFYTDTGRPGQASISFDAGEARQLLQLIEDIANDDLEGGDTTVVDNAVLDALAQDRSALHRLYERGGKHELETLIQNDVQASDIVATAGRRAQLIEFRRLLNDHDYFTTRAQAAAGPEMAWQKFFEKNQWIFGLGLCHTFLRGWDPARLEQTTTGKSVIGPGKRVDALMETTGFVRSLCFTEIKDHKTPLLQKDPNRAGVWAPSRPLVEAVAQIQRTVDEAMLSIGKYLEERDAGDYLTGQRSHLVYPRSFLVIGSLEELTSGTQGQENVAMVRSFELYRGSLAYPEIVTYDELLARAQFIAGDDSGIGAADSGERRR
jgi:hypothetical protein